MDYDIFISYASEDKDSVARPLALALRQLGYSIWYDEFTLKLGDSLRRSIDAGLANSRFGVVVLSPAFFQKNWPQYELDGLVQRENLQGQKVILPVWHNVDHLEVATYSPSLADRVAASSATGVSVIANKIANTLGHAYASQFEKPLANSSTSRMKDDALIIQRPELPANYPSDREKVARHRGRVKVAPQLTKYGKSDDSRDTSGGSILFIVGIFIGWMVVLFGVAAVAEADLLAQLGFLRYVIYPTLILLAFVVPPYFIQKISDKEIDKLNNL